MDPKEDMASEEVRIARRVRLREISPEIAEYYDALESGDYERAASARKVVEAKRPERHARMYAQALAADWSGVDVGLVEVPQAV